MKQLFFLLPGLLLLPACKTPKVLKNLRASITVHGTMNESKDEFEIKDCTLLVHPKENC